MRVAAMVDMVGEDASLDARMEKFLEIRCRQLEGLTVGEKKQVRVAPEEAYGEADDDAFDAALFVPDHGGGLHHPDLLDRRYDALLRLVVGQRLALQPGGGRPGLAAQWRHADADGSCARANPRPGHCRRHAERDPGAVDPGRQL